MSNSLNRPNVRRGLLIALDGLAIWVLAIILYGYLSAPIEIAGRGLYPLVLDTMTAWVESPGLGVWETAGYVGLVIAIVGPAWYLVARPASQNLTNLDQIGSIVSTVGTLETPMLRSGENQIEGGYQASNSADLEQIFSANPESRPTDWGAEMLTAGGHSGPLIPEHPTGDFLRSSGGQSLPDDKEETSQDSDHSVHATIRYSEKEGDAEEDLYVQQDRSPVVLAPSSKEESSEDASSPEQDRRNEQTGSIQATFTESDSHRESSSDPTEAIAESINGARQKIAIISNRIQSVNTSTNQRR